jgi:hypothetical protein
MHIPENSSNTNQGLQSSSHLIEDPISRAIEDQKKRLLKAKQEVNALERENSRFIRQNMDLTTCKEKIDEDLKAVAEDLSVIQSLAPGEATVEVDAILEEFKHLEESIGQLVDGILLRMIPETLQQRIRDGFVGRHAAPSEDIESFLRHASSYYEDVPLGFPIQIVLHNALRVWMMKEIFQPFVPGLPKEESEVFKGIFDSIREAETHDRSARWRTMAYSHLQRGLCVCEQMSHDALRYLSSVLNTFSGFKVSHLTVVNYFGPQTQTVMEHAVRFQNRVQSSLSDVTFEVSIPGTNTTHAEILYGTGSVTRLLIPVTMSLFAQTPGKNKEEKNIVLEECLHPVRYIADDWDPRAIMSANR